MVVNTVFIVNPLPTFRIEIRCLHIQGFDFLLTVHLSIILVINQLVFSQLCMGRPPTSVLIPDAA